MKESNVSVLTLQIVTVSDCRVQFGDFVNVCTVSLAIFPQSIVQLVHRILWR